MTGAFLIIVDVQKGFINDWTHAIPARVEALQDEFECVVATRFVNPEGSLHRRLIHWPRFAPGAAETELAFTPRPDATVYDKTTYTCLVDPLPAILAERRPDAVHLCGIATDNCVLKTAVDLFEAGIVPIVLADACASHGGEDCHAAGLKLIRRFIGEDQVVDYGFG